MPPNQYPGEHLPSPFTIPGQETHPLIPRLRGSLRWAQKPLRRGTSKLYTSVAVYHAVHWSLCRRSRDCDQRDDEGFPGSSLCYFASVIVPLLRVQFCFRLKTCHPSVDSWRCPLFEWSPHFSRDRGHCPRALKFCWQLLRDTVFSSL